MPYAIETRNLTRRFRDLTAVNDLTLAVPEGAIYGFLGLNGAGKTTTIKMLTTLLPATSGTARVGGYDVAADPQAVRRIVGLVGDEAGDSRPAWTAREYLTYFARIRNLERPAAEVEAILDTVDLERPARDRALGGLSTGMKRRVEIARTLLGRPRVIFLDEPTRGLDLPSKRDVWDFLRDLARDEKVTIFLSSHEVPEIQALCEDLSVIAKGRLTYSGKARALGADPQTFEDNLIRLLKGQTAAGAEVRAVA
ncbi:MAG TPA: ABC transporter ATP-binding protein [Candidatus Thermoplasmatota archaeon]|nr:ABC transporter ATP-binding protein [Candidatus Thermoplasmatota archaeon]